MARLWLTLQWCLYERIDRLPSEVSRYRDAMVSADLLSETLQQTTERLANAGRPDGERGYIWDTLWDERKFWGQHAKNFLRAMDAAGLVQQTENDGEYRQTLAAAVEIASLADRELAYLMPPPDPAVIEEQTYDMVRGDAPSPTEEGGDAGHSTH